MRATLIVIGLVAFLAAGALAAVLITGWGLSDDSPNLEPVAIMVTSTTTIPAPDPEPVSLSEACELLRDYFEPFQQHQANLTSRIARFVDPDAELDIQDRQFEAYREEYRFSLEALQDEVDVLVSKSQEAAKHDGPSGDGQALLEYARSSRAIMKAILETESMSEVGSVLDDEDEFRGYEAVRVRCEAASE